MVFCFAIAVANKEKVLQLTRAERATPSMAVGDTRQNSKNVIASPNMVGQTNELYATLFSTCSCSTVEAEQT